MKAKTLSQKQFGEVLNPSLKVNRSDCLSEKLYSMSVYLIRSLEAIRISVRLSVCQSVCPYGVYTSDCLSVCPYICLFDWFSVRLPVYLSVCLSACPSVIISVCLYVWLSICQCSISICLFVWLVICQYKYIRLFVCLTVHLSEYISVCLSHEPPLSSLFVPFRKKRCPPLICRTKSFN